MRKLIALAAFILAAHAQAAPYTGIVYLQIYACTDATYEDCQVYAVAAADGPRAIASCSKGLAGEVAAWHADGHEYVAGACVDRNGRDVTDMRLVKAAPITRF